MAKILLAKYNGANEPLDLCEVDTVQGEYIAELRQSGFVDFVASVQPTEEPGKSVVESLEMVDGKLVQSWHVQDAEESTGG